MKPNLKDFPAPSYDKAKPWYEHLKEYRDKTIAWKQNFQKEIQAIIWACENQPVQGENVKVHLQARIELCKEILGDE